MKDQSKLHRGDAAVVSLPAIPVTYELNERGESTGIAHPYCSTGCQQDGIDKLSGPVHVEATGGEDLGFAGNDFMCETCEGIL